jgi:hypothetical protein
MYTTASSTKLSIKLNEISVTIAPIIVETKTHACDSFVTFSARLPIPEKILPIIEYAKINETKLIKKIAM